MCETEGPGFESHARDHGCALVRNLIIEQNSRPLFPGFQRWCSLGRLMNSTIKINKISTNPHSNNLSFFKKEPVVLLPNAFIYDDSWDTSWVV